MEHVIEKRRVMFLFAHLHKGGMQRVVSNLSLALPDYFEQHVVFFGTENPEFEYRAQLHDVRIPGSMSVGLLGKLINAWHRLRAVRTLVKYNEIDIVISFGESSNVYNISSHHRAKKIISSRVDLEGGLADMGIYALPYRLLVHALYRHADLIVAVSEALGEQMRQIVSSRTRVVAIPNLYNVEHITSLSKQALPAVVGFLENRRFILSVGSLCHQKGQDDLLMVFADLHGHFDDLILVIIGRGEWKEQLLEQAVLLGISSKVLFVDFDENPFRYMSKAAVFVLTSRYEGFPNVLVEAMICGCPIVAFDCPTGPKEILDNGRYGILIFNRSVKDAAKSIAMLLNNDNLAAEFVLLAKQRAEKYRSDIIVKQWVDETSLLLVM